MDVPRWLRMAVVLTPAALAACAGEPGGAVPSASVKVTAPDGQEWDVAMDSAGRMLDRQVIQVDEDEHGRRDEGGSEADDEEGQDSERAVAQADLPAPVLEAIMSTAEAGAIESIEADAEHGTQTYEAQVKTADGQVVDVEVDVAGLVLKVEASDDNDDIENQSGENVDDDQDEVDPSREHDD